MKKRLKLTEKHPFFKRLDEVFELMEKNKLSIHTFGDQSVAVDHETGIEYELADRDDGRGFTSLPPSFEFKLVFERDVKE